MRNHEGCIRAYIRSSKAWYSKVIDREEIMIGMYHPEGGTSGEFKIEWVEIGKSITPILKCYDDAWSALWNFKDFLEELSKIDSENIDEFGVVQILDRLGIKDITEYRQK